MSQTGSKRTVCLAGVLLAVGAGAVAAEDSSAAATKSRFELHGQRFERATRQQSTEQRFRLDSSLAPAAARVTGGLGVHAKLLATTATACGGGVAIFTDGFE